MPGSIVCNVCGGKDFYNEAGFYFCNECQTQTQEIREQVFDQQDNTAHLRITKTTVRQEKSFSHVKLTSWEIFNHILYGLVEELNTLGVNKEFKEVCYHLWIHYLTKLDIMCKVTDGLPRLSGCFRRRDAEIIYNRSFSRRKKKKISTTASIISKSSGNSSSNDLDIKMMHKERSKQRRKLVRAEYDTYSTTKSSDTSLLNQTLSSLGSDSESVTSSVSQIVFSKSAKKELLKIMSRDHLNKHINDTENKLRCHRLSQKLFRSSYVNAHVITRNKLYAIIYIALRLTRDTYQLADILRFCREGHLSYMEYKHFFPDLLSDECIDDSVYLHGNLSLCAQTTRKQAWDIYQLLELKPGDLSPNLVELCQRYCRDLNLPDEVFNISANFINKTKPQFKISKKTHTFPNYEGRAMAFIMYTLKVLFGFDDATEYEFSNFAKLLNKKLTDTKMFVFDDWFNYIQYRKLILKNRHFPTKFLLEPNSRDSVDLYLKFIKEKKILRDFDEAATLSMKIAKKYLNELEICQDDASEDVVDFKPTVTPYRSYIDLIKSREYTINNILINQDILKDRSKDRVNFIINYRQYLKTIKSQKCDIKHAGKNTKHVFSKIRKVNWEIYDVHVRNWHKNFHKEKMEILHFDALLNKIVHKQKEISAKQTVLQEQRLNQSLPVIHYAEKRQITFKNNVGRDIKGRFCKKNSTENMGVENFKTRLKPDKWFVSSWIENPLLKEHTYNPSLAYRVVKDVERKLNRSANDVDLLDVSSTSNSNNSHMSNGSSSKSKKMKYPTHYCPWLEYWINVQEFTSRTSTEKWNEFYATLPKNFQWLLRECALIIEQKPIDLFIEFVHVELYMCYVHVNNAPVLNKYCDNYKTLTKLIQKVKNNW